MYLKKRTKYIAAVFLLLALLLVSQINLPFNITVPGKLVPREEWNLNKNSPEVYSQEYHDRLQIGNNVNRILTFERGDVTILNLNPKLQVGSTIDWGDSLGTIESNDLLMLQSTISGELETAEQNLKVFKSGEKQPLIDEARLEHIQSVTRFNNQKSIFERNLALYSDSLISDEEFEYHQSLFQIAENNIKIAKSHLDAVSIGLKPEVIQLQINKIENLKEQHKIINDRINNSILISPIDGIVEYPDLFETILSIRSESRFVVIFPVPLDKCDFITMGQSVNITLPGQNKVIGLVRIIDKNIALLKGKPTILTIAEIEEPIINVFPGQYVKGKFDGGKTSLFNQIKNFIN